MAKYKWLKLTGLVLASHLVLSACQGQQEAKPSSSTTQSSTQKKSDKKDKSTDKKTKSSDTKTSSTEKAIPGVTVPTSDGFILTDQSKILAHTKDGIVVDHDGHSHFIFYSDLKDTKFAHLIPADKLANITPTPTSTGTAAAGQTTAAGDHHYEFNPADIVAEDALGYTVRHGDHFHYILKSSLSPQQTAAASAAQPAPTTSHIASASTGNHLTPSTSSAGVAGIDFPTSDGFLFDGRGMAGWTDLGLLVNHDGHTHLLLKSDIAKSKWAYLLNDAVASTVQPTTPPTPPATPATVEQPITPEQPTASPQDDLSLKRAYLARETGLSEDKIVFLESPQGPGFLYPHDDHNHFVLLSHLDVTKPYHDGHEKKHEHQGNDNPPSTHHDDDHRHHQEPGKAREVTQPETPAKQGIPGIDYPTSDGFLFDGTGVEGWTSAGLMVTHNGHSHILSAEDIAKSKWAHLLPKDQGAVQPTPVTLSEKLTKQREDLAKQLGLSVEDIRVVTADGKVVGFEYPHEDHHHLIRVSDEETAKSGLTDEEKRELTAYIRKTYGLLLGTPVTFHDGFVVFAIPHPHQDYDPSRDYYSDVLDPQYDPGHVHPYAVPLAHLKVLETTNIPELDFENELQAAAKRIGVAPSEVKIKDKKYFVLPGKDHDHYLNILTPREGYEAYHANKLPEIKPGFVQGAYSKETVVAEADRILAAAESKFGAGTVEFRRVARALEAFKTNLSIATTSTEGYIQALQSFENQNVKGLAEQPKETTPAEKTDEFATAYLRLTEQLKGYDERTLQQYGLNPDQLVTKLQGFVATKNSQGLAQVTTHFAAIDRAKKASSDLAPRLAYMDYFLRHLDSDKLPASLRQEVINKLNELQKISGLYRNPEKFREGLESTALLKERVKEALAADGPAPDMANWQRYPIGFDRKEIVNTVNSMRDFLIKHKEMTAEELAEGFDKRLNPFQPLPKRSTAPVVTQPQPKPTEETNKPTEPTKPETGIETNEPGADQTDGKSDDNQSTPGKEVTPPTSPTETQPPKETLPTPPADTGDNDVTDGDEADDETSGENGSDQGSTETDLPRWRPIFEVPKYGTNEDDSDSDDEDSEDDDSFNLSGWRSIFGTPNSEGDETNGERNSDRETEALTPPRWRSILETPTGETP